MKIYAIEFTDEDGNKFKRFYESKETKIHENALRVILNKEGGNELNRIIDEYFEEETEQGEITLNGFGMPLKVKNISIVEID